MKPPRTRFTKIFRRTASNLGNIRENRYNGRFPPGESPQIHGTSTGIPSPGSVRGRHGPSPKLHMLFLKSLIATIGAVALLMWGTHLIRTGMLRTFGEALRHWLAKFLKNRGSAFVAGIGLSSLLQSSTASALLVASLQKKGLVTTAIALSSVLGADFGSALMVRVLSFDIRAIAPVLILIGVYLTLYRERTRYGQMGLIFLGLALVMMSLGTILDATSPLKSSPVLMGMFDVVSSQPLVAILLGVVLALLCFSSLAVVMIAAGIVSAGVLSPAASLWLVLGANLGSAFLALITTAASSRMARRAPLGNAVFRSSAFVVGCLVVAVSPQVVRFFSEMTDGVIYFHLIFNGVAGLVGLAFVQPVARWVDKRLPETDVVEQGDIRYLTAESRVTTDSALAAARAEIVRTVRLMEDFWHDIIPLLRENPSYGEILAIRSKKSMFDKRIKAVNRYMTDIMQGRLTAREARLWQQLRYANSNLQFCVTVIDNIFGVLDRKKCSKNRFFSREGTSELVAMHSRIRKNFEVLGDYLETEDPQRKANLQHWLKAEKSAVAVNDFLLIDSHVSRLSMGRSESVETSTLHIELLTLFRRVDQLLCSVGSFEAPDKGDLGLYFNA